MADAYEARGDEGVELLFWSEGGGDADGCGVQAVFGEGGLGEDGVEEAESGYSAIPITLFSQLVRVSVCVALE